jgi:hypothetical protein
MRIQLLKARLIERHNHAQGDVVEVEDRYGRKLIKDGSALEVKVTPAPALREAAFRPKTRKAVTSV